MSTGIHVLLIDSHDRLAERPEIPVCRANEARSHRISGAHAEERGVQGHAEGRNFRRRSGSDHCQGHRHRSARKVSKPGEPRTTV